MTKKNVPAVVVPESTEYENFLGKKDVEYLPPTLEDFIEVQDTEDEAWKKHWVGMPEFEQEDNPCFKKIIVSFRSKEDYLEFAKLVDQKLTEKTKTIWYPGLDKDANSLKRWFEDD
jgi:hypothetical protein